MSTQIADHSITRGDPFQPGILWLWAYDDDRNVIDVPVASYLDLICTIRKKQALAQPSDADTDVVAQVSLVPNAQGAITVVSTSRVRILVRGSVTRLWDQAEYFYDVQGHLIADGEPHTVVKGRIQLGWEASRTP
jgi:hypothetical protein